MLRPATRRDLTVAAVFVGALLLFTLGVVRFGDVPGAQIVPFIPIWATFWGAADLLTAYLLLTQFSVNGIRAFIYLGSAYAFAGLLTIPYVAFFPGVFHDPTAAVAPQQVSVYLWLIFGTSSFRSSSAGIVCTIRAFASGFTTARAFISASKSPRCA